MWWMMFSVSFCCLFRFLSVIPFVGSSTESKTTDTNHNIVEANQNDNSKKVTLEKEKVLNRSYDNDVASAEGKSILLKNTHTCHYQLFVFILSRMCGLCTVMAHGDTFFLGIS